MDDRLKTRLIDMRNILVHEYSGISPATVFDTVKISLSEIISVRDTLLIGDKK